MVGQARLTASPTFILAGYGQEIGIFVSDEGFFEPH